VNNEGTIEHLVNPINGFQVAHEMARVGGIIRHNGPLSGMREHGFMYPTAKFYAHMSGDNAYEVLRAAVRLTGAPTPFDDPFFTIRPEGLALIDVAFELIVRKTRESPFVFPVDQLQCSASQALKSRLNSNMAEYSKRRLASDTTPALRVE